MEMRREVDILIPVYDGYEETIQTIESVLSSGLDQGVFLSVINDKSPNERLTAWLRSASREHGFSLYENEVNLGFVQTVNRGMALHEDRDVILLNSDTIVAGNWVERICAHAEKDGKVASVTPFSNNATICSFPNFCEENALLPHPVGLIDRAFSKANAGLSEVIPTAIGFCMFISRASISEIGLFDADTFGAGYGEENDFCMRAVRAGWKHIVAADVFVAHIGGVSFSSEKYARVEAAQQTLDKLYPEYHRLVHEFIAGDSLMAYRMKAHAELIKLSEKKTILLISHRRGGGVEKHLQELELYQGEHGFFPTIRPGDREGLFEFAFSSLSNDKIQLSIPEDYDKLLSLCRSIGVGRVYFHHTMGISPELSKLSEDIGCAMDFMIHDYYLINANPTLTSKDGFFCDDLKSRDELCAQCYELPFGVSAEEWRAGQRLFLNKCERIMAPSQYTAKLLEEYFPDFSVKVLYHPDSLLGEYPEPKTPKLPREGKVKVLVLGAIGKEKGADILEATALLANKEEGGFQFHLLGYAYRPLEGVIEHGPYNGAELEEKISAIDPDLIWYPALWPETYSYTLSEGLRSALPIIAPDLGAFPERLLGRGYSALGDWKNSPEEWLKSFAAFTEGLESRRPDSKEWSAIYGASVEFYSSFWEGVRAMDCTPLDLSGFLLRSASGKSSKKEKFLLLLIKLREMQGARWISKKIPVSFQRRVKRYLSKTPMHELMSRKH